MEMSSRFCNISNNIFLFTSEADVGVAKINDIGVAKINNM